MDMSYYNKVKLQFNLVLLSTINKVVAASVVDRRTSDWNVVGSQFDFQIRNESLCPWERHFTHISHCGQAVYPL